MHTAAPPTPAADVEALLRELEALQARQEAIRAALTRGHRLATLGTLAAGISHELNNLLTPVTTLCDLALACNDPQLSRQALKRSLDAATKAGAVAQSVLGFAGQERPGPCDPAAVAGDALACLPRDPARQGVAVDVDCAPAAAAIGPLHLEQVVLNLAINALKAMPDGGRLTITGRIDGGFYHLRVTDTGPGIPQAALDRLFEPFATAPIHDEPTETAARGHTPSGGTGLGLCLCKEILEAAGGRIAVDSVRGKGTAVDVSVPLGA